MAEADVVDQEDDHVWRALGRLDLETRRRLGVAGIELGFVWIVRLRDRQHRSIDSARRGCGRRGGLRRLRGVAPPQPTIPARVNAAPTIVNKCRVLMIEVLVTP